MSITTLHSFDTEYSADSIEWCPTPNYRHYFVCGTYQLEGDNTASTSPPCRRKGRIYLFQFERETEKLTEVHRLETAAILDMKWLPQSTDGKPMLAAANALGQIVLFELVLEQEGRLILRATIDLNVDYHNLLALSLDWDWSSPESTGANGPRRILASDSKGDVSLIQCTAEYNLEKLHSWSAHNFEAWICAFDKWDMNRVYTGGDDTFLHIYDLRTYERVATNKSHIAGVTCLLSHPRREHLLLTGSYDERLRVFDTRTMNQPLGEVNLKGGVWRLKPDPLDQQLVLAACMYENFSIVSLTGENRQQPVLIGDYREHESICYGADWCLDVRQDDKQLYMATCSFYDHKLCIASLREA